MQIVFNVNSSVNGMKKLNCTIDDWNVNNSQIAAQLKLIQNNSLLACRMWKW